MHNIFLLALAAVISAVGAQSSFAQSAAEDTFCGRPIPTFSHVIDGTPGDDKPS